MNLSLYLLLPVENLFLRRCIWGEVALPSGRFCPSRTKDFILGAIPSSVLLNPDHALKGHQLTHLGDMIQARVKTYRETSGLTGNTVARQVLASWITVASVGFPRPDLRTIRVTNLRYRESRPCLVLDVSSTTILMRELSLVSSWCLWSVTMSSQVP